MPHHVQVDDIVKGALSGAAGVGIIGHILSRLTGKETVATMNEAQLKKFATDLLTDANQQLANYQHIVEDQRAQLDKQSQQIAQQAETQRVAQESQRADAERIDILVEQVKLRDAQIKRLTTSLRSTKAKVTSLEKSIKRQADLEDRIKQLEADNRLLKGMIRKEINIASDGALSDEEHRLLDEMPYSVPLDALDSLER